jgi:hypothetical protein
MIKIGSHIHNTLREHRIDCKTKGSPAIFNTVTKLMNKGYVKQRSQFCKRTFVSL